MKVINDFITGCINFLITFYEDVGLHTALLNLIDKLDDWQQYQTLFIEYMQGVYFLFGKSLIIYIVSVFVVVFIVRITFAIVNLIGQFVP